MKTGKGSARTGLLVVVPRHEGELQRRHEDSGLHPADEQLLGRHQDVVAVAADHVGQNERVSFQIELQQRRDQRLQSVLVGPPRIFVIHSGEQRRLLHLPCNAIHPIQLNTCI